MSRARSIGLLLVLVTLVAYLPGLRNGFVNLDDRDYVTENPIVQQGLTWQGIQWAFGTWHASNWHPVTWLSHMADCELFRLNPAGHHLTSILLHAANVCLLFVLWLRLTNALWASAMVAALFAWHPLHVESVAWVSERKDVLSTFFALLALLSYVRFAKSGAGGGRPAPPFYTSRFYWLALIFFALSLMSKPMLVTLPFVMVLLDFWPLQRYQETSFDTGFSLASPKGGEGRGEEALIFSTQFPSPQPGVALRYAQPLWRLLLEKWPFFLLTLASCAVTVLAQRAEAIAPLGKFSAGLRVENTVTAYAGYLFKTIWPAHLAAFYPLLKPIPLAAVALAVVVLLVISALVWSSAKSRPYLAVGWLWYLGTLVPVIGLVQVGDQALADRYTYFPVIGIFAAITWAAKDLAQRFQFLNKLLGAVAVAVAIGCLALTENQLRYWHDSGALFTHALAVTADNAPSRLNLGAAFQEENRPDDALAEYRAALRLDPNRHEIYNNIGRILNDQGRPAEALEYCRTAVALDQKSPQSHIGLGIVLAELGRFDEAMNEFSAAAQLNANDPAPHFQMAKTLLKQGRDAEAVPHMQDALRLRPDDLPMLIYTARVLAADENPQARNGAAALALAQKAAQLAGGPQPVVLDTLAMACAETGHFDEATQFAQQARDAAQAGGDKDDAAKMQQRLELYQKHQPARISFKTE